MEHTPKIGFNTQLLNFTLLGVLQIKPSIHIFVQKISDILNFNIMSIKTLDFFKYESELVFTHELDYSRVDEYIAIADAFARTTYKSIYIIDYYKKNFLYVSPNTFFLCGISPKEMEEIGIDFYSHIVPEEDILFGLDANRITFDFLGKVPPEDRINWSLQYDFNIMNDGKRMLVSHLGTPLALTSDGRMWLLLCIVSASTNDSPGNIELHRKGMSDYYTLNPVTRKFELQKGPSFSPQEKSIIIYSIRGYTMTEIADKMFLSPETIKKYRKRILEKLNAKNISEAIMMATNRHLL